MPNLTDRYREQTHAALSSVPDAQIMAAIQALRQVHERRGTIFVLCPPEDGTNVGHFVRELNEGIGAGPFAFRLVRLYGAPGQIIAWQNDWAYEDLYAEQMRGTIRNGDLVIAISARGDSLGMARALQAARRAGAQTVALVGYGGGEIKQYADICLHIQSDETARVEESQMALEHLLCDALRQSLSVSQPNVAAGRGAWPSGR
jgi:D-sedoheptulose 7-phosphate isomerase